MPDIDQTRQARNAKLRRQYFKWRLTHPFRSYEDFFVGAVNERLDQGKAHVTLGANRKDEDGFERAGKSIMKFLMRMGMEPHHRVVDYGCGSLRHGRAVMQYLEPGHYWGIDVTDRFYLDGLTTIDPAIVESQRPNLGVIADDLLDRIADPRPDYVFSVGVLIHVPRSALNRYFKRIAKITGPSTRTYVRSRLAAEYTQTGDQTWVHTFDELVRRAKRAGLDAAVVPRPDRDMSKQEKRERRYEDAPFIQLSPR